MKEPIITLNRISKKYQLGQIEPYITLRDTLTSLVKKNYKGKREDFWSLKDVSFTVYPGEIVGIIGKNGAGKSTLLKILSRITPPTTGEIKLRGKVASLLEVGTGFSPELTGRENIYLNAAILGMTRNEIKSLFDEIVAFAEVQKFIDTPVKHYSSGMYMRLAFSVAAHLRSDILFVDEVLAVGDAAFQVKCLNKMGEISQQGRTILFVSHSMQAVARLCTRSIWIDKGEIKFQGETQEVIKKYIKSSQKNERTKKPEAQVFPKDVEKAMQIRKVVFKNKDNKMVNSVEIGESFKIEVDYDVNKRVLEVYFSMLLSTEEQNRFLDSQESDYNKESLGYKKPGRYRTTIEVPGWLNAGDYTATFVFESGQQTFDKQQSQFFRITDGNVRTYSFEGRAPLLAPFVWKTEKLR